MEIFIGVALILILLMILRTVNNNSKKLDEIKRNMLTEHSFESPVQTYERITVGKIQ